MKKSSTPYLITLLFFLSLISYSCKNNKQQTNTQPFEKSSAPVQKTGVKLKHLNSQTKEYIKGKTIAVILGHSYNDEDTVNRFTQLLNLNYGLKTEESQGLIKVLVYPRDFMVAGRERISSLYSSLENDNLMGLITFGSPEGLCNAIAKLEDLSIKKQTEELENQKKQNESINAESAPSQEGTPENPKIISRNYPVFSYFQQDDSLGSESTADFVLDYTPPTTELALEQSAIIPNFDSTLLLMNSIDAMLNLRGPVPADKNLINFVQKLVGKQKTINNYNDYETGLKSINHFIFE